MKPFPVVLWATIVLPILSAQPIHAEEKPMSELSITSPAFSQNGMIPKRYTCDGADVSPPLEIANAPEGTKSLALIVDDPDAPAGTWVHWLVWNFAADTREIPENTIPPGALQGTNDFGKQTYGGPCPPSGTHRYFFKLYALNAPLALPAGARKAKVEEAIGGHLLGKAELIGLYRRK